MFEQSLLIDHAGTRKTATFAASLTAQILVAGVLITAPLFYSEVLPILRVPEIVPVLSRWRSPEVPVATPHTTTRSSGLALPGVFHPPIVIRSDYPQSGLVIIDLDAPVISSVPGMPALPLGSPTF